MNSEKIRIRTENLEKNFGSDVQVLKGLDLTIKEGDFIVSFK